MSKEERENSNLTSDNYLTNELYYCVNFGLDKSMQNREFKIEVKVL
jgi:hypothetical protein